MQSVSLSLLYLCSKEGGGKTMEWDGMGWDEIGQDRKGVVMMVMGGT
jgi:hypothetical protein